MDIEVCYIILLAATTLLHRKLINWYYSCNRSSVPVTLVPVYFSCSTWMTIRHMVIQLLIGGMIVPFLESAIAVWTPHALLLVDLFSSRHCFYIGFYWMMNWQLWAHRRICVIESWRCLKSSLGLSGSCKLDVSTDFVTWRHNIGSFKSWIEWL